MDFPCLKGEAHIRKGGQNNELRLLEILLHFFFFFFQFRSKQAKPLRYVKRTIPNNMLGAIGVKEHTMKKDWIPMLCTFDLALILTKNELETSTFSHLKNDN